jgi:pimeloyl-ACP methyl ester carboxylesterase
VSAPARRRLVLALLPLLMAGCSPVGSAAPQPTPPPPASPARTGEAAAPLARFYDQRLDWTPCRGEYTCARVEVPLDYDNPAGPTIELALLKVPASDPGRRLGSLLVNPGGPGVSALDYAQAADQVVSPAVRAVYDVVGLDPRGVGESTPLDCVTDEQFNASLDEGDPTPDTPAEVQAFVASVQEFGAGCEQRSPALTPHVGTVDVARDVDIVRAALGEERLTMLGKSYGTSIAAEYARQFPQRVGRLVLDGAVDPTLTDEDVLLGQAQGFELAYSRFAQACLSSGCSLGDSERQVQQAAQRVLALAERSPLPTTGRPLTEALATYGIAYPLYFPPQQGYPLLEAALQQALQGDGTALLQIADAYLLREPDGSLATNQWDAFTPISCLDRPGQSSVADVQQALPKFREASPIFGDSLAWGLLACLDWPVESEGLPSPVAASGAPPIVVVGTTGDAATPYAWAQGLADQLDSGVLLTYEGTPHTAYRKGSTCIDDAVDTYLLTGEPPADGTTCR